MVGKQLVHLLLEAGELSLLLLFLFSQHFVGLFSVFGHLVASKLLCLYVFLSK
jgi:hypothetical protein